MKVFFESKGKLIIVLVAVFQLFISFCSMQHYLEPSFLNIETQIEKNKLKEFMDAGTEKIPDTHNATPDEIIKTAQKYLGVPHCMGGITMKCMDCSGLLLTVFANYGIHLPHNSEEQARYGKIIAGKDDLKKGDLVFFINSYKTNNLITHSGIYIGNNKFIHASSSKGVTITPINDPWWEDKFIFGTRLLY
jgi:murein DD-endopeptidase / murein LD-carboxypeptidase